MSENLHDIDKLFRDGLEGHEDMPDAKVWDAVDSNLDKSNVVHIKRKYNNLKRVAAVLLVLLISTLVYELYNKKTGNKEVAGNTHSEKQQTVPGGNDKVADDKNGSAAAATPQAGTVTEAEKNQGTAKSPEPVTAENKKSAENAFNNAGKAGDDLKNNQPAVDNTEKNKRVIVNNNKNERNIRMAPVQNRNDDGNDNRPAVNKTARGNTKIKIKNGAVSGDTDNNPTGVNNADADVSDLLPYERNKLLTITGNKMVAAASLISRQSPNTVVKSTLKNTGPLKPFRFSLAAFFAPQYSTNTIKEESHNHNSGPGGPPPPSGNHHEEIKNQEQHQTAFSGGILFDMPLGKNWGIQSGVTYLGKTVTIEPKKIYARLDNDGKAKYLFDCSSGYTYISPKTGTTPSVGDSINAAASSSMLGYLGIPVAFNYSFAAGKFKIIPTVGTVINFLVKQKIETELEKGTVKDKQTINTIQGLKPAYFTATAGVSFEYALSKRIALGLTPAANFALSSINKDAAVKSYPNSFGVAGGIKIKF